MSSVVESIMLQTTESINSIVNTFAEVYIRDIWYSSSHKACRTLQSAILSKFNPVRYEKTLWILYTCRGRFRIESPFSATAATYLLLNIR